MTTLNTPTPNPDLSGMQNSLTQRLARLGSRIRALIALDAGVRGLAALLGLLTLSLLLDFWLELSLLVRLGYWLVTLGVAGYFIYRYGIKPLGKKLGPIEVAEAVDIAQNNSAEKQIAPRVATVLQLPGMLGDDGALSGQMVQDAVGRSYNWLQNADLRNVLDSKHTLQCVGMLFAALLVPGIVGGVMSTAGENVLSTWAQRWFLLADTPYPRNTAIEVEGLKDGRLVVPAGEFTTLRTLVTTKDGVPVEGARITIRPEDGDANTEPLTRFDDNDFRLDMTPMTKGATATIKAGDQTLEFKIEPAARPRLNGIKLTYAHSRSPENTQTIDFNGVEGEVSLLDNNKVTLTLTANVPIAEARYILPKTKPAPPAPKKDKPKAADDKDKGAPEPKEGEKPAEGSEPKEVAGSEAGAGTETNPADPAAEPTTATPAKKPVEQPVTQEEKAPALPPIKRVGPKTFTITWEHMDDMRFRIELVSEDAGLVSQPIPISVGLKTDRKPKVRMRSSGVSQEITQYAQIPLSIEGRDDLGLTDLKLSVTRIRTGEEITRQIFDPIVLHEDDAATLKEVRDKLALEVDQFNLRPTDVIRLTGVATDNRYLDPQEGKSLVLSFTIVEPKELFRKILARQQGARSDFRKAIEDTKDIYATLLEAKNDGKKMAAESRKFGLIMRNVQKLTAELERTAEEMRLNRLGGSKEDGNQAYEIMKSKILDPLRQLHSSDMTAQRQRLSDADGKGAQQLKSVVEGQQGVIVKMNDLLKQMNDWDELLDALNQLNEVIDFQEQIKNRLPELIEKEKEKQFD